MFLELKKNNSPLVGAGIAYDGREIKCDFGKRGHITLYFDQMLDTDVEKAAISVRHEI